MHTLPTLSDELNRKSLEAMVWLTEQYEAGQITEAEFYIGRAVAFQIISGLVPEDIAQLTWAEEPAGFKEREEVRVLRKGEHRAVLRRRVGDLIVRVNDGFNDHTARFIKKPLTEVVSALVSKGWIPS